MGVKWGGTERLRFVPDSNRSYVVRRAATTGIPSDGASVTLRRTTCTW